MYSAAANEKSGVIQRTTHLICWVVRTNLVVPQILKDFNFHGHSSIAALSGSIIHRCCQEKILYRQSDQYLGMSGSPACFIGRIWRRLAAALYVVSCPDVNNNHLLIILTFYLRPVLAASGYCRCVHLWLCLSVCPSIHVWGNHELFCAITCHPFKLGSPNSDQCCKRPWLRSLVLWGYWPWPSRSSLIWKSKFAPFWACPCDKWPPFQGRIS